MSRNENRAAHGWSAGRAGRRGGIAAGVLALAVALGVAACGGGGGIEGTSKADVRTVTLSPPPSGSLTISNWSLYIDKNTVPDFEKATGVDVNYIEDFNSNEEFFAKMQPLLAQGQSGGRSLFAGVTDWMAKKMYDLGYLQNLDKAGIPNVEKNLLPALRHPAVDPNRNYSVPWQTGMTGLVVRTDLAPDIHSVCDLFDPRYHGRVDLFTELRETVPLVMKCQGVDLSDATESDWMAAIDKIKGAVDSGQIRRLAGGDWVRDVVTGDAVASTGGSGDSVQLQADNPNIKFVMPTQGCILWSDNMVIPVGAPNPTAAEAWMNYVYDPVHQAQIEDYVNYVTPVNGTKSVLLKQDPSVANNDLIFPSDQFTAKCDTAPVLTGDEEQRVTRAFDAVVNA